MAKKGFKTENPNKRIAERTATEEKNSEPIKETESKKDDTQNTEPPKEEKKGKPGRPRISNKKKQYTLTMNPDLYETLSELAKENYKSFSQLVTDACIEYMKKL